MNLLTYFFTHFKVLISINLTLSLGPFAQVYSYFWYVTN